MTDAPTELDDLRALVQRQAKEIERLTRPAPDYSCRCDWCARIDVQIAKASQVPAPDVNEGHV